ncbi:sugar phosphate nucleotidyltransferase [Bdellovibrio bacteriovorus]|uniref:sugar phosphate nucleotidyltransferase n=1 Tax=Bdellovibrio TaxID=958 RepID=UPI0035A82FB9
MNVMLLAAGEGTRLRPYTEILPKPAIPFLTVPLAAHSLSFLRGNAIDKLVVNTYYLPQKIHELFHRLPHKAQSLHFSDEVGQILGSGGGLGNARKHFIGGGDFVMMNADEVILPKDSQILKKALQLHKRSGALATIMVMDDPRVGTQFGGVWADANNKVLGFGKTALPGAKKGWHFIGVQILSEKVFDYIPTTGESNILYDALVAGIQKGDLVQAFPFECGWFETGNPQDFLEASEKCFGYLADSENSFQKEALQATLKEFASEPVHVEKKGSAKLITSQSTKLEKNVQIEGLFVSGQGSVIGENSHLKNVIVGAGVAVPANTEASDKLFI